MITSRFNPLGPAHFVPNYGIDSPGPTQVRVAIFYATRQGHTGQIAEHIGAGLREHGFDVDVLSVQNPIPFPLRNYSAAVLAASVHGGRHEKEMVDFVKEYRSELDRMITAFISVTLSQAGAERRTASPEEHAQFVKDVERMLCDFFSETKWLPTFTRPVAGALLYTRYNFLLRLIMKSIAKKAGGGTDTSRDYVYTDWNELDKFVEELATNFHAVQHTPPALVKQ